jgi:hypothetical protein
MDNQKISQIKEMFNSPTQKVCKIIKRKSEQCLIELDTAGCVVNGRWMTSKVRYIAINIDPMPDVDEYVIDLIGK